MTAAGTPAERAAAAVDAMRRLWLELTRVAIGRGEAALQAELFHDWLHRLPLGATPPVSLGVSMALSGARTRWFALGDTTTMIPPTSDQLRVLGASAADLDVIARLGPAVDARQLGCWMQFRGDEVGGGWTMTGDPDPTAALQAVADDAQRAALLAAIGRWSTTTLRSIGRSIGDSPVTQLVLDVGPASDDAAVLALTDLIADLEAPELGDDVLGIVLHEAAERSLGLSVWTLADGLARIGIVVERPSTTLLVRLAMAGGWGDGAARAAALLGTAGLEVADRLEWYLDAAGPDLEVTAVLPDRLPAVADLTVED